MPREIHSNENTVSFLRRFTIGKSNILSIVKFSGLFAQFSNYHPVIFFMSIPEDLFGCVFLGKKWRLQTLGTEYKQALK